MRRLKQEFNLSSHGATSTDENGLRMHHAYNIVNPLADIHVLFSLWGFVDIPGICWVSGLRLEFGLGLG